MSKVTILNKSEDHLSWYNVKQGDIVIFRQGSRIEKALCIKFEEENTNLALVALDGHDIWDTFNPLNFSSEGSGVLLLAHYNSGKIQIEFNLDGD